MLQEAIVLHLEFVLHKSCLQRYDLNVVISAFFPLNFKKEKPWKVKFIVQPYIKMEHFQIKNETIAAK